MIWNICLHVVLVIIWCQPVSKLLIGSITIKKKKMDSFQMLLDTYAGCDLVLDVALEAVHL